MTGGAALADRPVHRTGPGRRRVVVIGGGLAGISAALDLLDHGIPVTLVEARPDLGGAAGTLRRGAATIDTGQHVFLRCYQEYLRLLRRLGTGGATEIRPLAVPVLRPGGPVAWLRRTAGLPAPAHLLPALLGYGPLTRTQRLSAIRAAAALRRVQPDARSDRVSFGAWLSRHGQSGVAVERLWGPICVAALNAPPDGASLALAARVFRTGLLGRAAAGDIGLPLVPLHDLHAAPARTLLERLGADVRTATRARGIHILRTGAGSGAWSGGGARTVVDAAHAAGRRGGFLVDLAGSAVHADAVVVAVPHQVAAGLVPAGAVPGRDRWHLLGDSAIINVHLRYARPVTDLRFAAAVDSPVQWLFDLSRQDAEAAGGAAGGQHLVVSLSAADGLAGVPGPELAARIHDALGELLPAARRTPLTGMFTVRQPRATFREAPGCGRWRPGTRTRVPGLLLAGAWTATGWPDTMEGAVRSGRLAADAVRAHLASKPTVMGVAR